MFRIFWLIGLNTWGKPQQYLSAPLATTKASFLVAAHHPLTKKTRGFAQSPLLHVERLFERHRGYTRRFPPSMFIVSSMTSLIITWHLIVVLYPGYNKYCAYCVDLGKDTDVSAVLSPSKKVWKKTVKHATQAKTDPDIGKCISITFS